MGSLKGVKAGDELLRVTNYGGPRKKTQTPSVVTVHKVGRTLVHILRYAGQPDGPTDTYQIENGIESGNYSHTQLYTREEWEAERRRDDLTDALRRHGVEAWRKGPKPVTVLEALLKVLEEAEGS